MHSHLAAMVGRYIFEERQKVAMLQKDLAKELGVSAQFLGRIEKGEVMIPEDALKTAIKTLDLQASKLTKIYRCAAGLQVEDIINSIKVRKRA